MEPFAHSAQHMLQAAPLLQRHALMLHLQHCNSAISTTYYEQRRTATVGWVLW
jgi:hypothetical protein